MTTKSSSLARSNQTPTETTIDPLQTPSHEAIGVKEFLKITTLPCFAKITRDCRHRRGPDKERDEEVFVYSTASVRYVIADEMSVVHRKHIQPTSQRFYVPLDCKGWFEVLSQDGLSARPYVSVAELSKLATSSRCLVRQSVGGYVRKSEGYDTQIIRKGDVLSVSETMWISTRSGGGPFNKQLLRCVDQRGQEVFLDMNQRGMFSPIAGNTNVTGAHSIQSLLAKFRLPVMIRLLYGSIRQPTGSTYSTGVFKLISVFSDEILFTLALKPRPENRILPIPTRAKSLKLRPIQKSKNDAIQHLRRHCKLLVSRHLDTVISVTALYESSWLLTDIELEPVETEDKKDRHGTRSNSTPASAEEEELFREIEDIYNNIGCGPNSIPRPIVFTAETVVARGKVLRRNMTTVAKAKTVQHRTSCAAPPQNTRIIDDNWQMLPRQLVDSALSLQVNPDANALTTDAQVQTSPKPERNKRKPAPNIAAAAKKKESKRGEHLYEEIPYFSKTSLDANDMDVQKTMYISDTSISCPDSQNDLTLSKAGKLQESGISYHRSSLAKTLPTGKPDVNNKEALSLRKHVSRPKSFAGTAFVDESGIDQMEIPLEKPPPLPPKRGESMCNLADDLHATDPRISENGEISNTPSPHFEASGTLDSSGGDLTAETSATIPSKASTVERRQSSKVTSAVKTLGNVSRTFFNTFRRFGAKNSATLVISSPDETSKQPVGAGGRSSSKESFAKSSSGSSPEPQQAVGDKQEPLDPSLSPKSDGDLSCFL